MNSLNFGMLYQYGNEFYTEPRKYDYINLFQVGELCSCYDYVVPLHKQICHEISYIISGTGSFYVNGKEFEVKEGDFFINCIGDQHSIKSSRHNNLRFFYIGFLIDAEIIAMNEPLIRMFEFFSAHHNQPICSSRYDTISLMSRLNNEFYNGGELSQFVIENLLKQILFDVYRSFIKTGNKTVFFPKEGHMAGNIIYSVINYIDNHILEIIKIQDIAKAIGYSPSYLSHLFRVKIGVTIQQYLINKKIEKSIEMIHNGQYNVTQIASLLNYNTLQSFSRIFKNVTSISPSEYIKHASVQNARLSAAACSLDWKEAGHNRYQEG